MHIPRKPSNDADLTRAELLALPVVVDVPTAARALGLGRSTAYELARRGEFPCPILRVGSSYRVPTAGLLRILGVEPPTAPDALDVPLGRARAS
jgi:excisionase family DNA binding protein